MSRRQAAAPFRYEFEKNGAFGVFKTNGSVPIEYFMTSFKVDELPYLSYAKDVNTELNFDYLIQRDIDEDRAIADLIAENLKDSFDDLARTLKFKDFLYSKSEELDEEL